MSKLFIVESPTKIKTLKKILSKLHPNFILLPTFGHIKDLPKESLGVELETLKPRFVYLRGKLKVLKELKRLATKVREVYLGTDPDREGEAISYHLWEYLHSQNDRLVFYRLDLREITPLGVSEALKNLRSLDRRLYESFLARRVLDRLIGYLVSPMLSRAFKQALSAGRVQSPALRLIVERERERRNFVPQINYGLKIVLKKGDQTFLAELCYKKRPYRTKTKEELEEFIQRCLLGKELFASEVVKKKEKELPPAPFKTSTLIESAGKVFGFSAKETMLLAQRLYEEGYITYHRTDSTRVSPLAKEMAAKYILEHYGNDYVHGKVKRTRSKLVQDAHEAIRPTDLRHIGATLPPKEARLYGLIWQRLLASEMAPALYLRQTATLKADALPDDFYFTYTAKKLIFPGFRILYKEEESPYVELRPDDLLELVEANIEKLETKPKERYTEETLIKKLESLGIGRPSTYATMLDILYRRGYIKKVKRELVPTELGERVCDFLMSEKPFFMDYHYTAHLEVELDNIANAAGSYEEVVRKVLTELQRHTKDDPK